MKEAQTAERGTTTTKVLKHKPHITSSQVPPPINTKNKKTELITFPSWTDITTHSGYTILIKFLPKVHLYCEVFTY
jgi:hypothetical protein